MDVRDEDLTSDDGGQYNAQYSFWKDPKSAAHQKQNYLEL